MPDTVSLIATLRSYSEVFIGSFQWYRYVFEDYLISNPFFILIPVFSAPVIKSVTLRKQCYLLSHRKSVVIRKESALLSSFLALAVSREFENTKPIL